MQLKGYGHQAEGATEQLAVFPQGQKGKPKIGVAHCFAGDVAFVPHCWCEDSDCGLVVWGRCCSVGVLNGLNSAVGQLPFDV
jgi:hypothetical protein